MTTEHTEHTEGRGAPPAPAPGSRGEPLRRSRADLIALFRRELPGCPWVLAAWFGGSDATGRTDSLSDVDLYVLVQPGATARYWQAQESWLAGMAAVRRQFCLPEPTPHGAAQRFIQFEGLSDAHMLDVCVLETLDPGTWLGEERHGRAQVIHDPCGLLVVPELDRSALARRLERRAGELARSVPLFAHLVSKAVTRGRELEALAFYQGLVLRPLVELLRIRHCPERHDFGMRYLEQDLPADLHAGIRELAFVGGAAELPDLLTRALGLFEETLRGLEPQGADAEPVDPD